VTDGSGAAAGGPSPEGAEEDGETDGPADSGVTGAAIAGDGTAAGKAIAGGAGAGTGTAGAGTIGGSGATAPVRPEAGFEPLGRPSAARATAAGQESMTGVKAGGPAEGRDSGAGRSG
jgi:hypothetical protein